MHHFTSQTLQTTVSKFVLGDLYSIGMKMGIIKGVLTKGFMKKKEKRNYFPYQLFI